MLVGRLSSSKEDPGGLLIKRVVDLKKSIVELRASKADAPSLGKTATWKEPPATAAEPSLAWSLATKPSSSQAGASALTSGGQDTQELHQKVRTLERRVTDLEAQLGGQSIVVAGSEFKSITDAGAWLNANAPIDGDYAYFLDAHVQYAHQQMC
jgi:hypothetical protein